MVTRVSLLVLGMNDLQQRAQYIILWSLQDKICASQVKTFTAVQRNILIFCSSDRGQLAFTTLSTFAVFLGQLLWLVFGDSRDTRQSETDDVV